MDIIKDFTNQNQHLLQPDLRMAKRFLTTLTQCDEQDNCFAFQTFLDKKGSQDNLTRVFTGNFEEFENTLVELNQKEAGIFVCINKTNGKGRKAKNIIEGRAFFIDIDEGILDPIFKAPISPHIIVESSSGRYHAYWIVENINLEYFSDIQKQLSNRFKSDPQVNDLSRVMRLPGFFHHKKEPFLTKIIEESKELPVSFEHFVNAFKIKLPLKTNFTPTDNFNNDNIILKTLNVQGMLIEKQSHPKGCWAIQCPWKHLHSTEDKGTKYYEPNTNGYTGHGFKCFHTHCKDRTITDLMIFLGIQNKSNIQVPQPLFRVIVPSTQFPVKALSPIIQDAAETLHRIIGAPLNLCAQSVLGCAGLATQPYFNVTVDGRIYPLSLYMISVGESGERKTGIDNVVLDPVRSYEKEMLKEYTVESQRFKNEYDLYEKQRKMLISSSDKDIDDLNDLGLPPSAPLDPVMIIPEPTFPALVVHLSKSVPSVGLFSSEGGQLIGGYAMKEENLLNSAAGFSSLWDKGEINRARVKDGVYNLYGKRVSLNLMIQPIVAEKFFSNQILIGQGFFSRCLICWPESTIGTRPYQKENIFENSKIKEFRLKAMDILNYKLPIIEGSNNQLNPINVTLDKSAYEHWVQFHDEVEKNMLPDGDYYQIKAFASKIPDNALRIAGILFGFNQGPNIDHLNSEEIPLYYVENAIKIAQFYLSETLRIHGISQIDYDLKEAQKLLDWIKEKKLKTFPTCYLYQYGPNSIRDVKKAKNLLAILQEHGWIKGPEKGQWEGKSYKDLWVIIKP
ncbi:MAG: hypothetical protein K940chlam4_00009 [Candidatus Anoxychlamydiales bacterium]|nr:hypothetical protein [Candidatus Anoxychlamydiales bacterium]